MRISFCLLMVLFASFAFGQNQTELTNIKAKIAENEKELEALSSRKDTTVRQLELVTQKISGERRAARLLSSQVAANNKRIADLRREETRLKRKITEHESQGRMGIIFMLNNADAPTARIVFGGADPAVISAAGEILEQITNNLYAKIRVYIQTALEAADLQKKITEENRQLENARREREEIRKQYDNSRRQFSETLSAIRADENARQKYLEKLKQDEERINRALRESARRRAAYNPNTPFARERGKLPQPMRGRVIEPFGERLIPEAGVRIRHNGIKISPTGNGDVVSVAEGRVVYVDYISGRRNVVIVQHDSEYYTVYANLDEFYVKVSDNLKRNAAIGRIDVDFKDDSSYLYFEIRRQENAVNPAQWLGR